MPKPPVLLEEVYAEHIDKENEKNRVERYEGKEEFYHASGAGTCSRKLYYQTVEQANITNPANSTGARIMRLGTLLHNDFEKAFAYYSIYNTKYNTNVLHSYSYGQDFSFKVEKEIQIPELGVRGFYDVVVTDERTGGVFLYDLKSTADYSFKRMFGTTGARTHMQHQEMQLATYGYAVNEECDSKLEGMYLAYYNKNTSIMKYKEVPLNMMSTAYMFWANTKKSHESGLPAFSEGISPVQKWECNYCQYYDHCKPPYKRTRK